MVDETQMIDDIQRGPTLEMILTRLKRENKDLQIIAISAALHRDSVERLAKWLNAESLIEDWRPIDLVEGKYSFDKEQLVFSDGTAEKFLPNAIKEITEVLGGKKRVFHRIFSVQSPHKRNRPNEDTMESKRTGPRRAILITILLKNVHISFHVSTF